MPRADELLENLLLLTRPQAEVLRKENFDTDVDKIVARVRRELAHRPSRGAVPGWLAGVAVLVAATLGVATSPLILPILGLSRVTPTDAILARRIASIEDANRRAVSARDVARAEVRKLKPKLASYEKEFEISKVSIKCKSEAGAKRQFSKIDSAAAIAACRYAVELDPKNVEAQTWLGRAYHAAEQFGNARNWYEELQSRVMLGQ